MISYHGKAYSISVTELLIYYAIHSLKELH